MLRPAFAAAITAALTYLVASPVRATEPSTRVLIVVGPSTHPPGTHEVAAGARLLKHCLEHAANVKNIEVDLNDGWPSDAKLRDRADTIVFVGDTFPPARLPETEKIMGELSSMMDRGCGIACFHYATGLRATDIAADGDHPLLRWMGGYFATHCPHHKSVATIMTSTITPASPSHPVSRGWREFTVKDEPYYNNYFGPQGMASNVTAIATSMLPPEDPKLETVGWAVERKDGGRGVAVVMPHFYRNWANDDLRRLVLNAVVWSAKRDVPDDGVQTDTPDLEKFAPAAIDAAPRPEKPAKKS